MSDRDGESQTDRGFKVEDRRRFASSGEPRSEASTRDDQPETPTVSEDVAPADQPHAPPLPEITFSTFTISLSTQALVHLGEIPNPLGEESPPDLVAAQQLIDILGVLQEKTRGNLDAAEKSLLDSVLYDLRLRFVERAKRAPGS